MKQPQEELPPSGGPKNRVLPERYEREANAASEKKAAPVRPPKKFNKSRYEQEALDSMGSVRDDRKAVKYEVSEPKTKQKLIAKLKSCKTFLRQILNSDWLRYTLLAVILLNMVMLVSAYIVTQYFNTDLQQYLDLAFKFFDAFYALEIACKLLAYVFLAGQRWKYLTNKIFLMEVAIGAFHCLDLAFWESNTTLRVLRLFFVLRLLTLFKSLQKFTKYMIHSE